ncbi:MAG TPA: cyclopropane-fatty-acyl-phospholipid synthase family protein [Solirubrobacteraceae bacterium]|nr:cyclopropane-fatty-acyl-phospholipid synthase family protein [Solirubrobacteraceae bacterium]
MSALRPADPGRLGERLHTVELAQAAQELTKPPPFTSGSLDRAARRIVLRLLAKLRGGELVLIEPGARLCFGESGAEHPLRVTVHVSSPRFYRVLLRGSVGLCESYMDGLWDCEDLVGLTQIAALNVRSFDRLRHVLSPVLVPFQRSVRWLARNTPTRSRKQIAAHYDLGNELFSLFLDPTMMYSCAIFDTPAATLEQASLAKLERVCAKLNLSPADHVLEIGTGWGGFAVYAAERYGCRVTTTTISTEQHAYATERVLAAGLQERVTVLLEDYRALLGRYDKLVSIEMIEAVGWQYFQAFFRRCSQLLSDDGAMLLQAIVIDDRAYEVEKASKSFINTYIFPGGCLPSMEVISRSVARVTDMRPVHLEDITAHYAETLRRWRERFLASTDSVAALGYDERFRRLWELYLAYCEGGFRERRIRDVQLLLAKPGFRDEPRASEPLRAERPPLVA